MRGVLSRFQLATPDGNGNGVILKAGSPGRGFRLVPGAPNVKSGQNANALQVPGSFPVRVRFRDGKQAGVIDVLNDDALYFDEDFGDFDILDCDVGDSWCVYIFETRENGIMPGGNKTVLPVRLASAVAVQNGGTPVGNAGFPLRPGLTSFTSYVVGGARADNVLWVRKLDGTWFSLGDVWDATVSTYDVRVIGTPGDRWCWVAGGAGETIDVEAKYEAG